MKFGRVAYVIARRWHWIFCELTGPNRSATRGTDIEESFTSRAARFALRFQRKIVRSQQILFRNMLHQQWIVMMTLLVGNMVSCYFQGIAMGYDTCVQSHGVALWVSIRVMVRGSSLAWSGSDVAWVLSNQGAIPKACGWLLFRGRSTHLFSGGLSNLNSWTTGT